MRKTKTKNNETTDAVIEFIEALTKAIDKRKALGKRLTVKDAAVLALNTPIKNHIESVSFSGTTKVKRKR